MALNLLFFTISSLVCTPQMVQYLEQHKIGRYQIRTGKNNNRQQGQADHNSWLAISSPLLRNHKQQIGPLDMELVLQKAVKNQLSSVRGVAKSAEDGTNKLAKSQGTVISLLCGVPEAHLPYPSSPPSGPLPKFRARARPLLPRVKLASDSRSCGGNTKHPAAA